MLHTNDLDEGEALELPGKRPILGGLVQSKDQKDDSANHRNEPGISSGILAEAAYWSTTPQVTGTVPTDPQAIIPFARDTAVTGAS